MKLIENISIHKKVSFVIIIIFLLSIISAAIFAAISFRKSAIGLSYETAKLVSDSYSEKIEAEINNEIKVFDFFQNSLITGGELSFSKDKLLAYIEANLKNNKNLQSIYQIWEPGIYTKNDSIFSNIGSNDSLKRFKPHVYKFSNEILFKETDIENIVTQENIYVSIRNKRKQMISEPFFIRDKGEDKLCISVISPIISGNRFLGITGFNYILENTKRIINEPTYYGEKPKILLVTNNKTIVYISGKDRLSGTNIEEYNGFENKLFNKFRHSNLIYKEGKYTGSFSYINIRNSENKWKLFYFTSQNSIIKNFIKNIYFVILIATVMMLIGLAIGIYILKRLFKPLEYITKIADDVKLGKITKIKKLNTKDEFAKIQNTFRSIAEHNRQLIQVSEDIIEGKYVEVKARSKDDVLSLGIEKVVKNIKKIVAKGSEQKEDSDRQLWIRRGRFEIANIQRESSQNLHELALNLVKSIVDYTDAILGGIYLNATENTPYIELIAAYAYNNEKFISEKILPGEGLVGTCAIEKKKIELTNIPDNYIKIASGLGSAKPRYLLIQPIIHNEKLVAFIEIAFIKTPEDYRLTFIEQLVDNIGAWLESSLTNIRTTELLEKSQIQTKELSLKENELNAKVQEMQEIQKKSEESAAEMKSMLNAVNHTIMRVEYTPEGSILHANDFYLKIMKHELADIKGRNVFNVVKDKEALKKIIARVSKGEFIEMEIERHKSTGESVWVAASYTPYYNSENKVTRIIFFGYDITEIKVNRDNLKKAKEELEATGKRNIEMVRKYRQITEELDFESERKSARLAVLKRNLEKKNKKEE